MEKAIQPKIEFLSDLVKPEYVGVLPDVDLATGAIRQESQNTLSCFDNTQLLKQSSNDIQQIKGNNNVEREKLNRIELANIITEEVYSIDRAIRGFLRVTCSTQVPLAYSNDFKIASCTVPKSLKGKIVDVLIGYSNLLNDPLVDVLDRGSLMHFENIPLSTDDLVTMDIIRN